MTYYDEDPVREALVLTMARRRAGEAWEDMSGEDRSKASWEARDVLDQVAAAGLAVVDLNPDRRMFPERTAETADVWSECTRVLVYAAEGRTGLRYPGDVYRMLGSMKVGAGRLPELTDRARAFLSRQLAAGDLKLDAMGPEDGVSVRDHVEAARIALDDTAKAAHQMSGAMGRAQNALSRVAYNGVDAES